MPCKPGSILFQTQQGSLYWITLVNKTCRVFYSDTNSMLDINPFCLKNIQGACLYNPRVFVKKCSVKSIRTHCSSVKSHYQIAERNTIYTHANKRKLPPYNLMQHKLLSTLVMPYATRGTILAGCVGHLCYAVCLTRQETG